MQCQQLLWQLKGSFVDVDFSALWETLTSPLTSQSISEKLTSALWHCVIRLVLVLAVTTGFVQLSL